MIHAAVGADYQSARHTSTPKGRFVLRADSIRPYSLGGEAAAIQRTALSRQAAGGFYPPLRLACSIVTGRVRKVLYSYNPP